MYSIAIPLKDLALEVRRQAYLYHQITAYYYGIAYARLALAVINMEAMINYLAVIKLRYAKSHFDVMPHEVHASGHTKFYFIIPHLAFILFSVFSLYSAAGISAISQLC